MLLLGLTPWLLTKLCCVSSQQHWDRWPGTVPTQRGKLQELRQIATNGCVSLIWNSTYYDVVLCWPTYWFIFLGINLIGPWPTCCTWLAVDCHLVAIWPLYLVRSIIPDVSLPFLLPKGGFPLALWGSLFPQRFIALFYLRGVWQGITIEYESPNLSTEKKFMCDSCEGYTHKLQPLQNVELSQYVLFSGLLVLLQSRREHLICLGPQTKRACLQSVVTNMRRMLLSLYNELC